MFSPFSSIFTSCALEFLRRRKERNVLGYEIFFCLAIFFFFWLPSSSFPCSLIVIIATLCVYCIKCNKHITTLSSLRNNKQQRYPPTFFSDGVPCSIPVYMQYAHVLHFIPLVSKKGYKKICFCFVLCGKRRKKCFLPCVLFSNASAGNLLLY